MHVNIEGREDDVTASTTGMEPRELAYRATDGLEVALLWVESTNRLVVSVADERTGDRFALRVGHANALDVFYHPFAHAARRGVEYRTALLRPSEPPVGAER
jgi:hypothetical protein